MDGAIALVHGDWMVTPVGIDTYADAACTMHASVRFWWEHEERRPLAENTPRSA